MNLYPVVDRIPLEDRLSLGIDGHAHQPLPSLGVPARDVMAVRVGSFRPPRKGEWYLSGAEPEAYRAPNDLTTSFHIVRLVRTETKTVTSIIGG